MIFQLCAEKRWFQNRGKATEQAKPAGTLEGLSQLKRNKRVALIRVPASEVNHLRV